MPQFNWSLLEDEVEKYYVLDDHTAEETLEFLRGKYKIPVTLKQLKTKFGGRKKIKKTEWLSSRSQLKKRRRVESTVLLEGRPIPAKRVMTGMRRYKAALSPSPLSNSFEEQFSTQSIPEIARVEVRSPPAAMAAEYRIMPVDLDQVFGRYSSPTFGHSESPIISRLATTAGHDGLEVSHNGDLQPVSGCRLSPNDRRSLMGNIPDAQLPGSLEEFDASTNMAVNQRVRQAVSYNGDNTGTESVLRFKTFLDQRLTHTVQKSASHFSKFAHCFEKGLQNAFNDVMALAFNSSLEPHELSQLAWELEKTDRLDNILSTTGSHSFSIPALSEEFLKAAIQEKTTELANILHEKRAKISDLHLGELDWSSQTTDSVNSILHICPKSLSGDPGGRFLYDHIEKGRCDIELVKRVIDVGANVNWRDAYREPIVAAIRKGTPDIVEALLDAGVDVNNSSKDGRPLIWEALLAGRSGIVDLLITRGAKLSVYYDGQNALDMVDCLATLKKVQRHAGVPETSFTTSDIVTAAEEGAFHLKHFLRSHQDSTKVHLERALCKAIKERSLVAFRTLLQHGVDPDIRAYRETTQDQVFPLFELVRTTTRYDAYENHNKHDFEYIYALAAAGADVNTEGIIEGYWVGESPWLLPLLKNFGLDLSTHGPRLLEQLGLCYDDSIAMVDYLLDNGIPIDSYGEDYTCLQAAAKSPNTSLVQFLVDRGADVNMPPKREKGQFALESALSEYKCYEDMTIFEVLVKAGANLDASFNRPGAFEALANMFQNENRYGDDEHLLRILLEHGMPFEELDELYEGNTLETIVSWGDKGLLLLAIDGGVGLGNAVFLACETGNLNLIRLLVANGVDVNTPAWNEYRSTALQAATSSDTPNMEVIEYLLAQGAEINAPPALNGGFTALQGAAMCGPVEVARLLIEKGADIHAPGAAIDGKTAIESAASLGRFDMVQLLLNESVERPLRMVLESAISLATANGHLTIRDLLSDHVTKPLPENHLDPHATDSGNMISHGLSVADNIMNLKGAIETFSFETWLEPKEADNQDILNDQVTTLVTEDHFESYTASFSGMVLPDLGNADDILDSEGAVGTSNFEAWPELYDDGNVLDLFDGEVVDFELLQ